VHLNINFINTKKMNPNKGLIKGFFYFFFIILIPCSDMAQTPYPLTVFTPIHIPNPYFGTDSLVGNWEPSVVYFPNGWGKNKAKYWMAWTPNDKDDTQYENPCIAYSNDGIQWDTTGMSNPVVDAPRDKNGNAIGFNSDPDLFYSPLTDSLYLIWKCSDWNTWVKQTGDGFNWGSHKYNWDSRVFIPPFKFRGEMNKKISPVVSVEDSGKRFLCYARLGPDGVTNWGFVRWTLDQNFHILDTTYFDIGNNPDSIYAWHFKVVRNPSDKHYYFFTDGAKNGRSVWAGSYIWVARSQDTLGKVFSFASSPLTPRGNWYKVTALLDNQVFKLWCGTTAGIIYECSINASALYSLTNVAKTSVALPEAIQLFSNFPNPFNSGTSISYLLKEEGDVSVSMYNTAGQLVNKIPDEVETAGSHTIRWNGTNQRGVELPSGVYFVRIAHRSLTGKTSIAGQSAVLLK